MKLSGFKSFVDPVTIEFPSQLIGVVGPNGCGKSNIIDAVRWVLGESSAKNLRGDAMTDVIFNGASTRRSVGQASVELRFDNQKGKFGGQFNQYHEISIKRSVNRDGDSAYYLNGKRCRKRDITDMFLGTGAGSRGYSIISQGTISQLIEAKPLTLRAYLEEAAGISKYKERRRETLQRIEHTKANLARINDISQELDKQVQRLQRQAKTAERYQKLKQEATQCRIRIAANKWLQHKAAKEQYQQQLEELAQQISELKQQRASFVHEASKAQTSLQEQQQLFNQKQKAYYEQQSELARIEEQALLKEKEYQTLEKQQYQAENDRQQITDTISEEEQKSRDYQQQLKQIEEKLSELTESYQSAQNRLTSLEKRQQEQVQKSQALISQQQALKHNQQLTQLKLDQLSDKQQQWFTQLDNTDIQDLTTSINEIKRKKNQLENDKKQYEHNIENLETTLQTLQKNEQDQQQTLSELKRKIKTIEEDYQKTLRQKTIVDASIEASVEHKEKSKPHFLEKHPPVFQNINVEKEWQTVFHWIASQQIQGYFIEDIPTLIKHKKQLQHSGLILCQKSQTKRSKHKLTLADVIEGSKPESNLNLDSVILTDTVEEAFSQLDTLSKEESILSKDGFWLGKTWLWCMPANDKDSVNLLAIAHEQTTLKERLNALTQELEGYQQTQQDGDKKLQDTVESIRLKQTELNQQSQQSQQTQTELIICHNQQQQAEKEKLRLENLNQQCQIELETIASERLSLESQLNTTQAKIDDVEKQLSAFDNIDQQAEVLAAERDIVADYQNQLQEYKLKKQQLIQNEQNSQQQTIYWLSKLETVSDRIKHIKASLLELSSQPETDKEKDIERIKQDHAGRKTALDRLQADIEKQKQISDDYRQQADTLLQRSNDIEHLFQNTQLHAQESTIRQEDAQAQLDHFHIKAEDAVTDLDGSDNIAHLTQQLEHCENRIKQLGAVNLAAKTEFDEEMARKETLEAQQSDLANAIETLNQAINKIDKETKTRFSETFDQVNETFQHLFPTVFGGGKASLKLEGDDWLESGVVVMAQPPGKRNSTIQLLSGGEKALTAVALVFALFQLNPSPFCLLDEVDAPLDDANVGRFCHLVKQMSDHVQFIIITHNKVTMMLADHLIGVTMREPGVSRLVAVDVAEAIEMSTK